MILLNIPQFRYYSDFYPLQIKKKDVFSNKKVRESINKPVAKHQL